MNIKRVFKVTVRTVMVSTHIGILYQQVSKCKYLYWSEKKWYWGIPSENRWMSVQSFV